MVTINFAQQDLYKRGLRMAMLNGIVQEGNIASIPEGSQMTSASAIDGLLDPIPREEFFERWWEKCFLHVPGKAAKFGGLLTWTELSTIIERHDAKPPRLLLFKQGKQVDAKSYVEDSDTLSYV